MSKARSPREVCSTTMGTNGLIEALLRACCSGPALDAGGVRFGVRHGRVAGGGLFGGDRGRELGRAVEREPEPQILAHPLFRVGGEQLLQDLLGVLLTGDVLAEDLLEPGVVDLDAL